LAQQAEIDPEIAAQFAQRVSQELNGYKGTPFFALYHLSRRLMELAVESDGGGGWAEHIYRH
jgi:hypothetical protein